MRGLLLRSADKDAVLEMIYQDDKDNLSQRRIRVLSVEEETFKAYCYARRQQRSFKSNNVLSIIPAKTMKRGA
jgi:predicted DNA-binding transcriptional regulator YafY